MRNGSLIFAAATVAAGLSMGAGALAQSAGDPASAGAGSARTVQAGDADGAFSSPANFGENSGASLYAHVCAGCHMPDAKGAEGAGRYPALAGNAKLKEGGYPVYVIVHGLNGMPPVGEMMTDQQVADVTNYVRTHFGNKYKDKVTLADVKAAR